MSSEQSFFLLGDCKDPAYRNVRDDPTRPDVRKFVNSLWSRYCDLADPHFRKDAQNHFLERFWEMYLGVTLRERGFQLTRVGDEGPEFHFLHNHRKVWVEAVAPRPGTGKDRVPEPDYRYGQVCKVPTEKILLRFTNALDEKRNKYIKALQKNIIKPNDLYLLAMNSRNIPHAPYRNTMPFYVQAFLPFGNLTADIDTKTGNIVDTFYEYRENVVKASEAAVSTTAFLSPKFSFVSAILHSAVDCVNHPDILGEDFIILHNPTASCPLDPTAFPWCEQMSYRDGRLERQPGQ